MQGMDNTTTARRTIAAEKPNKLRVQTESGMMAANLISDGAKLVTHLPAMQTYTEAAAPASFDAMLQDPAASGGPGGLFILQLLASDPYAALMDGVTSSQYIGQEQIDGRDVHHLKFTQQQFTWEMWVDADEAPLVRRVSVDMSQALGGFAPPGSQATSMQSTTTGTFSNWKFNEPAPTGTFAFTPPPGTNQGGGELQQLQEAFAQAFQRKAGARDGQNSSGQPPASAESGTTVAPPNTTGTASTRTEPPGDLLPKHRFEASPRGGPHNIRAIVSPESRSQQQWQELAIALTQRYGDRGDRFLVNFFSSESALEGWSGTNDVANKDRPVWLAWLIIMRQGSSFTPQFTKIVSDEDRKPIQ
jgi:hypothetical protein